MIIFTVNDYYGLAIDLMSVCFPIEQQHSFHCISQQIGNLYLYILIHNNIINGWQMICSFSGENES